MTAQEAKMIGDIARDEKKQKRSTLIKLKQLEIK